MSADESTIHGWRDQKKNQTKARIQQEALRLFSEQGYQATTAEQIAARAQVSRATFFRYFATKADTIVYDVFAVRTLQAFLAIPPDIPPITALRMALLQSLKQMNTEEQASEHHRARLLSSEPELQTKAAELFAYRLPLMIEVMAKRMGRSQDDLEVRVLAGASIGVVMAAWAGERRDTNTDGFIERHVQAMDQALACLEPSTGKVRNPAT